MSTYYAELHAHSNFSVLEGASHIEELVLRARELRARSPAAAVALSCGRSGYQ